MRDYITIQADTFDQVALKEYGNELATREIMAENGTDDPEVLTVWRFAYGYSLAIPEEVPSAVSVATLPEYRRPE